MNAIELVLTIDGPLISLPFTLLHRLQDAAAAIFLKQSAYLTAVKMREGNDEWFHLPQVGAPSLDPHATLYDRLGSWEALGCGGPDAQKQIRRKLKELGLLEEFFGRQPAKLWYKVDPNRYVSFLIGDPASGNPEAGLRKTGSQPRKRRRPASGMSDALYKEAPKELTKTHPAAMAAGEPCLRRGESSRMIDIPTGLLRQLDSTWRQRLYREVMLMLDEHARDDLTSYLLERAQNPVSVLQAVKLTGQWDPPVESVARPGETHAQAAARLAKGKAKISDEAHKRNPEPDPSLVLQAVEDQPDEFKAWLRARRDNVSLSLLEHGGIGARGLGKVRTQFYLATKGIPSHSPSAL